MRIVITCTFDRTARIRCPPCIGCSKTLSNSDYNDADIDPRHLLPSIQRLKPRRLLGNSRSHGGGATADVESWNHIPISAGSVLPQDLRLALGARAFPPTREEGNLRVKAPTTTLLGPKRLWIIIVNIIIIIIIVVVVVVVAGAAWKSFPMEILRKSYGNPMEILWKSHGNPTETR